MALQSCKMIYICLVTCRFDALLFVKCWFHVETSLVVSIDESTLFQLLFLFLNTMQHNFRKHNVLYIKLQLMIMKQIKLKSILNFRLGSMRETRRNSEKSPLQKNAKNNKNTKSSIN